MIKKLFSMAVAISLVMSMAVSSSAIIMGEKNDNENDAEWGTKFRDYLCDYNGNLVETNMGASAFKLSFNTEESPDDNDAKKGAFINSISVIATSKGPNGQSTKSSKDRFIAVEIILSTPVAAKTDDFSIFYKLICKRDIKDAKDNSILNKDDTAEGCWYGRGKSIEKPISSSMSISETASRNIAYASFDYDMKTIIKFDNLLTYAVDWQSSEASKYLAFTTDRDSLGLPHIHKKDTKCIKFISEPKWSTTGRLIFNCKSTDIVYSVNKNGLVEENGGWYDPTIRGYILETPKLTAYVISPVALGQDGSEYIELPDPEPEEHYEEPVSEPIQIEQVISEMPKIEESSISEPSAITLPPVEEVIASEPERSSLAEPNLEPIVEQEPPVQKKQSSFKPILFGLVLIASFLTFALAVLMNYRRDRG